MRECHHGQLRVDGDARGEDARVADVQVLEPVDPERRGIDHPLRRIGADDVAALRVCRVQEQAGAVLRVAVQTFCRAPGPIRRSGTGTLRASPAAAPAAK